jgi:hypothetical protein
LKSPGHFGLLVVFLRRSVAEFNHGGIRMNNKLLSCLIAGALGAMLALASPALARGGGHGGGMHGGGMGGGMRMGGGAHFSGGHFAGAHFAHAGFSPHSSRFGFRDHRFHHRFHRFAFFGAPFAYAAYDSCWRRVWTPYGVRWTNVCGDYGY